MQVRAVVVVGSTRLKMEPPTAPGEFGTCGSMLVRVGGTIPGVLDKLERLEEGGIAMEDGALGILVTNADGMSSGPPEGAAGAVA